MGRRRTTPETGSRSQRVGERLRASRRRSRCPTRRGGPRAPRGRPRRGHPSSARRRRRARSARAIPSPRDTRRRARRASRDGGACRQHRRAPASAGRLVSGATTGRRRQRHGRGQARLRAARAAMKRRATGWGAATDRHPQGLSTTSKRPCPPGIAKRRTNDCRAVAASTAARSSPANRPANLERSDPERVHLDGLPLPRRQASRRCARPSTSTPSRRRLAAAARRRRRSRSRSGCPRCERRRSPRAHRGELGGEVRVTGSPPRGGRAHGRTRACRPPCRTPRVPVSRRVCEHALGDGGGRPGASRARGPRRSVASARKNLRTTHSRHATIRRTTDIRRRRGPVGVAITNWSAAEHELGLDAGLHAGRAYQRARTLAAARTMAVAAGSRSSEPARRRLTSWASCTPSSATNFQPPTGPRPH